jgi:uncharacterized membrane-anchored protein
MRRLLTLAIAGLCLAASAPQQAQAKDNAPPPTAQEQARISQLKAIQDSLHPQTGDVRLPDADVVLHLGENYYFLPADEAKRVLTEGWGNPPDAVGNVLGLVFPKGKTFADDIWGAVITFQASGYVTDEDAQSADYNEVLTQLRSGEDEENAERTRQGYPAMHLVGWAQPPAYDPRTHAVVWARNLQVSGAPENTLNYDVRLLGRRGVLSLNMITGMSQLAETGAAATKFASAAEFVPGARYADFKSGDAKAGYGIAGLVAAGVGVAAAKKLGLLAIILGFGKKLILVILALFAGIGAWFRHKFGGGGDEVDTGHYEEPAYEQPAAYAGDGTVSGSEEAGDEGPRPGPAV